MVGLLLSLLSFFLLLSSSAASTVCRCFPSDPCWPTPQQWDDFNTTISGRLIATTPLGSVCHTNNTFTSYDASACASLRSIWDYPSTHYTTSSSPMAPWFTNFSCNPFFHSNTPCTIGPLIRYAVNATSASDYQKTLNFTQTHNIRLVIRNTGHDYLGKSTGAGALALWTHHLKDIQIISNYNSAFYTGPAIKVGAGVQFFEAMAAAHKQDFVLVGGNCQSVGYAGGYTQGGGHGQLASKFGLAADQVLEWEVVTADGELLTASETENRDLYWALCGGGGGTYGAVLSMTSKVYPELRTTTANLSFSAEGVKEGVYWGIVERFVKGLLPLTDAGGVVIWEATSEMFTVTPATIPGGTKGQLEGWLSPTIELLKRYNISYTYNIGEFPTYWESYVAMNPMSNVTEAQIGGRMIPRSTVENNSSALITAFRTIANYGAAISGVSMNASRNAIPDNAVNPAWRGIAIDIVLGTTFNYYNRTADLLNQRLMTNVLLPLLEALSPDSGAYLNEADIHQPNWQWVFYRDNYATLSDIKDKYDPNEIFYARTGVGSERWTELEDGRLCRVNGFR
ncbi:FAD binding domain protein [Aspergillus sclerotioniger CBS 115572]|uniref:FAD binding domain protein n=1 Tax=Aspergillus sclerotioniger CBS 115572 TaxID=1450535 RepID=A0A317XE80_9EURO|nr:FAD binding domain protein [Aspergillus sclerotioniger CBS 115572]PWY96635.1 FAD binding domain protein [Aspergillus sclerotioniger CBS 115572]